MTVQTATSHPFVTANDAQRYLAAGYWSPSETLPGRLAEHAANRPDVIAVIDDAGRRMTYADLHRQSSQLACGMRERGVQPGDVVGLQLPNRMETSIVILAIEKAGAIACPMVTPYRKKELSFIIHHTNMKLLFVPGMHRDFDHDALGRELMDEAESLSTVVSLASPAAGIVSFDALLDTADDGHEFDDPDLDPDAVVAILFTSGTESAPKGVLHTSNTLLSNTRALREMLSLTSDDGVFMASPVGHGTGYGFGTRLACYLGSTLSLLGVWAPTRAAEMLQGYGAAYTHGATPFVADLLSLPNVTDYNFGRLRYFVTGGAAVPPGTATRASERLGCRLLRLYGQTEGFMSTLSSVDDTPADVDNSDGSPVQGVEVRVVDDDSRVVPFGEAGECQYRGPHRCVGFLDDTERQAASMTPDGWFRSGDIVVISSDGHLTVAGRKKEVINRGGYKYSPREVEDILMTHPGINQVAVVRMPDARLVERACAFIVARGDARPTVNELATYLDAHGIASFKWPERVELVPELPNTASGKVQKFQLEFMLNSLMGAEGVRNASSNRRSDPCGPETFEGRNSV
jgi:non-ribosomal peptide synthetase component E (peptide arylation enzyme)